MKMSANGYLIPANPQPEDMVCLLLYIPNDPLYIKAMAGGFSDYGRWFQWERDGTNRASLAARAWKDAIDYTFENGWLVCEDMQDKLDDILDQLRTLNDMQINVNCGCGCNCGCSGGSGNTDLLNPDGTPINTPLPNPPSTTEPDEFVGAWQCDAANEFVDGWIDFYNNLLSVGALGSVSVTVLLPLFVAATILTGGMVAIIALVMALTISPGIAVLGWVTAWLEENRSELICVMANSLTPATAYQNVTAYLVANKMNSNGSFAGEWVENILKPALQDTDWNLLFTPDSMPIRLSNQESTCNCQGVAELPEFEGWYLVPAIEGIEEVTAGSIEVTNYIWNYVSSNGGRAESDNDISEFIADGRTWIGDVRASGEHAGYVIQKIGVSGSVNLFPFVSDPMIGIEEADWAAGEVWTKWATTSGLDKASFQAGLEAIFAGYTIEHTADRTFSNASQHRVAVAGSGVCNTQFRVFAVVAGTALNIA